MHSIPGEHEIVGVTSLDDKLYVLRAGQSFIDVHSTTDFAKLNRLTVSEMRNPSDTASCERKKCLYISESSRMCIHRLQLHGSVSTNISKWPLTDEPSGLSVTTTGNVLTACRKQVRGWTGSYIYHYILELNGDDGKHVRQIEMQADMNKFTLQHSIQLSTDKFVTCHTNHLDTHRVCTVGVDGKVTRSYRGSDVGQLGNPCHLAVDTDSQFIFLADKRSHRVVLLSPTLEFVRHISEGVHSEPQRLHYDPVKQRLYIGLRGGRVTVLQLFCVELVS